jgi:hypothetical protein
MGICCEILAAPHFETDCTAIRLKLLMVGKKPKYVLPQQNTAQFRTNWQFPILVDVKANDAHANANNIFIRKQTEARYLDIVRI